MGVSACASDGEELVGARLRAWGMVTCRFIASSLFGGSDVVEVTVIWRAMNEERSTTFWQSSVDGDAL